MLPPQSPSSTSEPVCRRMPVCFSSRTACADLCARAWKDNCQIKWHKVYFISMRVWPKHFASEICDIYFRATPTVIEKHCSVRCVCSPICNKALLPSFCGLKGLSQGDMIEIFNWIRDPTLFSMSGGEWKTPISQGFHQKARTTPSTNTLSSFPFYQAVSLAWILSVSEMGSLDEAPFNPTYNK